MDAGNVLISAKYNGMAEIFLFGFHCIKFPLIFSQPNLVMWSSNP